MSPRSRVKLPSDSSISSLKPSCPGAPALSIAQDVYPGISSHEIFIWISLICTAITCLLMGFLMLLHVLNYTIPREQKLILRIVALPAIYGVCNMLSVIFYHTAIYIDEFEKISEAVAIVSLFELYVVHLTQRATTKGEREMYFEGAERHKHNWFGIWTKNLKHDKGSLRWFKVTHLLAFQYLPVSLFLAVLQWIFAAVQCPNGKKAQATHLLLSVIGAVLISFAIFALLTFERRFKIPLKSLGSKRKLWCMKLFVGVSVTLTIAFAILQHFTNVGKETPRLNYFDLTIGMPDVLFELIMVGFSLLFFWAFSWVMYRRAAGLQDENGTVVKKLGVLRAICDAINLIDVIRGVGEAWMTLIRLPMGKGNRGVGYKAGGEKMVSYSPETKPGLGVYEKATVEQLGGQGMMNV